MKAVSKHNNNVFQKVEKTQLTSEKVQKVKTPSGHIRFNKNFFLLETNCLPKGKIFCKSCRAENARIIGKFSDDNKIIHYVIKCPWHPNDTQILSEDVFREKYPNVLPEKVTNYDNFPIQKSYCKNCRGTTGKIVGETETAWLINCSCGEEWFENKLRFAEKYIGTNDTPPLFKQREPLTPKNWSDQENITSTFQRLKEIIPGGIIKNLSENKPKSDVNNIPSSSTVQNEPIHKEENIQLDVNGITLSVPKGATIKIGKLLLEFK